MDPETLRASMPALSETTYLNTGAGSPTPTRVVDEVVDTLEYLSYESPAAEGMYPAAFDAIDAAREPVASFLGAAPEEIAFTRSTADGINVLAGALDLQPGDVVVRTDLEHPAGVLPWDRLADSRDIEVRVLETERGRLSMEAVKDVAGEARLFCLSSLTWSHGTQLPVAEIVDIAHDAGAEVLVDAVQSPGQVPVDVKSWGADYAVGAGHKWLLGVWGGGFLYVDADAIDRLAPERAGYRSVEDPSAADYAFKPSAARLEVGTTSPLPYAGLVEGIRTIEDVGLDTIQSRIERLTDRLKAGLPDESLLSPREYESGLVTFRVDNPEATVERLKREDIVVRPLPFPEGAVRASVHVFNTAADIDALLDGL